MKKLTIHTLFKCIPLVGVLLFLYIIWDVGVEKIGQAFLSIPPLFYLLSLLVFIPRLFFFVYKWNYINRKQRIYVDFWYLTKIFLVSVFYGSVTPGGIGWHMRIFYLKKKSGASFEKCITNSILDTVTGFIVGLSLALLGSILFFEHFSGFLPLVLVVLILYISAFVIFMKKERGSKIFTFFIRPLIPKKYRDAIGQSISSLYEDLPRIRDMTIPMVLEVLVWLTAGLQTYIIALAFSIEIPVLTFILLSIMAVVFSNALPITIGGLGVREGFFVVILGFYGVSPETAFAISFVGFLVKIVIPGLIGLGLSFNLHLKPTKEM